MSKRVSKINLHQIGGHRYLNSKYIIFLAFHVISEDHVMKDLTFPAAITCSKLTTETLE